MFLQDNNQFHPAEKLYHEALSSYRHLARNNPTTYKSNVAMTLNNLGRLVANDSQRRNEAETVISNLSKSTYS